MQWDQVLEAQNAGVLGHCPHGVHVVDTMYWRPWTTWCASASQETVASNSRVCALHRYLDEGSLYILDIGTTKSLD